MLPRDAVLINFSLNNQRRSHLNVDDHWAPRHGPVHVAAPVDLEVVPGGVPFPDCLQAHLVVVSVSGIGHPAGLFPTIPGPGRLP